MPAGLVLLQGHAYSTDEIQSTRLSLLPSKAGGARVEVCASINAVQSTHVDNEMVELWRKLKLRIPTEENVVYIDMV